ncbi:MAG: hypothetical protein A3K19_03305 [Lentisphaerae bacterium RIFOXYB12_FULL_65_16]|nr:MAG: hypothetical protein A3K18_33100 [Lentisphaerae bacterium RIFOXYA12_64_32]OGV92203.1 MAG: hypothetical protein A3K19_03305 [Lentisphaerae bacterium RIFOXYB12_FULL_65_16]
MERNQASVDPDAIDEAAKTLEGFMLRVRDFDNRLNSQLNQLGSTFQDDAYDRFCASFQTTRKLTAKFADETAAVLPRLRDDAKRIRAAQHLKPLI